jgi:CheY-like chemotaxis protein/nitrogen-specific signal transduction histidine kinase
MRQVKRAKAAQQRRKVARVRRVQSRTESTETALAILAHEIRTPLNGILAFSELIAAADLPERERQWATHIKSAAEHLANLSTVVVDGVRAEARGLVLRAEPFRLRALADALAGTLGARAETKGLVSEIAIAEDIPEFVIGDQVRLRAALENLADNAVKFTDRGNIAFAVAAQAASRGRHRVSFSFSDSGIGLTRTEIAKLFRPFSQASEAVARRFGGAGLGLLFVKRLAEAMNGKLAIKSTPGQGSTFVFSVVLEATRPASPAPGGGAAAGATAAAKSLQVLCAEDNPYARVVHNTILTELGHQVDFAGTGEAAVAAVERGGYDLVLMDVTLPGLDGLGATRAIRALPGAVSRVPIIGISGRTEPADVKAATAAGMNAFLAKPVSPAVLAEAVAGLARP